jgi:hypothetical protein
MSRAVVKPVRVIEPPTVAYGALVGAGEGGLVGRLVGRAVGAKVGAVDPHLRLVVAVGAVTSNSPLAESHAVSAVHVESTAELAALYPSASEFEMYSVPAVHALLLAHLRLVVAVGPSSMYAPAPQSVTSAHRALVAAVW